ncbi:endoglucanase [Isoptericola sp. CG 20/1183]|uniref:Glucanase n=1 Tax=Isoptericola halotolerans TaxID=300560 RepID=A0ABX5EFZ6_9MICO|nr:MULTISPECIES: glycoside hydrolase family 6 protein [Isoptericola]MCK0116442.1 glycoside hydrolase family 6 protein [Isoptericola sp. S6320L]PRZ08328.1 endoglucanase [Isoptericola halotolerans]PRZ09125.1 endoglucanase [Isoptericola sp. CG 20/1183]
MSHRVRLAAATAAAALCLTALVGAGPAGAHPPRPADPELWVDPHSSTRGHIAELGLTGDALADAELLAEIPTATWFTAGSPRSVKQDVKKVVVHAHAARQVPVLVAYNLPFRDCAQYSAGGATSVAEYEAWIDGFARGIGNKQAVVVLEPDGLGIIPWYTTFEGTQEWCQPAEADPATAAAERFAMLNYAVDALGELPGTRVYLDAGHSGWLNVGDNTDRLLQAGVERADGFYLNASNYQYTTNLEAYGRWISSCLTMVTELGAAPGDCGNQYWNGGPATDWAGAELTPFTEWSSGPLDEVPLEQNTIGIDSRYAAALGDTEPSTHFVIDTSRNGQGPWDPATSSNTYADPEDWCNPPGRGLGERPTLDVADPLIDAYLWIKVPGESDGQCYRGTGGPLDPERGMVDPPAGAWFVEQADELIALADPALTAP